MCSFDCNLNVLPRQGEMAENTPFTRKCTSEPSRTLEKVTTKTDREIHKKIEMIGDQMKKRNIEREHIIKERQMGLVQLEN